MRLTRQKGPSVPVFQAPAKQEIEASPPQVAHFNIGKMIMKPYQEPIAKGFGVPLYCFQEGYLDFKDENADTFTLKSKITPQMTNRVSLTDLLQDFQVPELQELVFDKGIRPGKRPLQF